MEDMFAFEQSDNFAFDKIFKADGTVLVGVSDFHFFYLIDFDAHSIKLFF